jgi:hypothetical protein
MTKNINTENDGGKIKCPCGSRIFESSLKRHVTTKRHIKFIETGLSKPENHAEYQRRRFASNPSCRDKHRASCKSYYEKNKKKINKRHIDNYATRKKIIEGYMKLQVALMEHRMENRMENRMVKPNISDHKIEIPPLLL